MYCIYFRAKVKMTGQISLRFLLPVQELRYVKAKAIPLQALTGPEGSRRMRLPDFKTNGT
jgi:hypothetical protein